MSKAETISTAANKIADRAFQNSKGSRSMSGFAAASIAGSVTASHFSMNCLKPAVGRCFIAKGTTLRAGRRQVFARAELFAENEQGEMSLVATGETVLVPLDG